MFERLTKLRLGIIVPSIVVLIFVSVASAEQTRCFWCGPLAEQVHRSQRAPSCDTFKVEPQETACDPGYSYCATIAVSPPYSESRLCVKFYQDECYSVYCNTTKTWRMVCACRGDLCNGAHSERETQAFSLVPKFASKTRSRNKRNLVANFISVKTRTPVNDNDTVIIISKDLNETVSILSDQPAESNETSNPVTATPKRAEDTYLIIHGNLKNVDKITDPLNKEENHNEKVHFVEPTMSNMADKHVDANNTANHLDGPNMDAHVNGTKINSDAAKDHANTEMNTPVTMTTRAAEIVKESHDSTDTTTALMKPTTIEISVAVQTSATSVKRPPAEALQQDVTPTTAMEVATMGTVATSTDNHVTETTTLPTVYTAYLKKKNNASKNLGNIMMFFSSFFLQYHV